MSYHLPTFEEAVLLCEQNKAFIHSIHVIDGYEVHNFSYRLASYSDFKDNNAFEFRGLCFVKLDDGTYRRYLSLHKFFNINENEDTQLDQLVQRKIAYVQTKFDGTLIRFIQLPNGRIIAKTKAGFDNEYCKKAMELLDANPTLKTLVVNSIRSGVADFFELVGFEKIVLKYNHPELILIQQRVEKDGSYLVMDDFTSKLYDCVSVAKTASCSDLISFLREMEGMVDFEGYVITFDDGSIVKAKTEWYRNLHRLVTETVDRENALIEVILNNQVDDLIANISDNEVKENVFAIESNLYRFIRIKSDYIYGLMEYEFKKTSRKDFAIDHKNDSLFSVMMSISNNITEEAAENAVKEWILKRTKTLTEARKFLKEIS